MKITFLGTNGWYSTKIADAICTLIETKKYYIVLDAGEGLHKLNDHITKNLPVYLFLSHLHLDHIFGLHILPRMHFKDRLTIILPANKYKDLQKVINSPFTAPIKNNVKKIVPVKTGKVEELPFSFECQKLKHPDASLGYRLTLDGKTIAYCSDTGYCGSSTKLAKNCDILIHECTNKPGQIDGGWGHTNPEEAARVAASAGAKKLFLTHFMPDFYPTKKSRKSAQTAARKIFKNSTAAMDGMSFEF